MDESTPGPVDESSSLKWIGGGAYRLGLRHFEFLLFPRPLSQQWNSKSVSDPKSRPKGNRLSIPDLNLTALGWMKNEYHQGKNECCKGDVKGGRVIHSAIAEEASTTTTTKMGGTGVVQQPEERVWRKSFKSGPWRLKKKKRRKNQIGCTMTHACPVSGGSWVERTGETRMENDYAYVRVERRGRASDHDDERGVPEATDSETGDRIRMCSGDDKDRLVKKYEAPKGARTWRRRSELAELAGDGKGVLGDKSPPDARVRSGMQVCGGDGEAGRGSYAVDTNGKINSDGTEKERIVETRAAGCQSGTEKTRLPACSYEDRTGGEEEPGQM
ncbi:hypothetical protein C8R43DRAFT_949299 [Mycena crocata]|nr:hypothetical protein C8R43DRAFT_949299 [Mycena crocata]